MEQTATITSPDGGVFFKLMKPIYEQFSGSEIPLVVNGCKGLEDFVSAATMGRGTLNVAFEEIFTPVEPVENRVLVAYTGGGERIVHPRQLGSFAVAWKFTFFSLRA